MPTPFTISSFNLPTAVNFMMTIHHFLCHLFCEKLLSFTPRRVTNKIQKLHRRSSQLKLRADNLCTLANTAPWIPIVRQHYSIGIWWLRWRTHATDWEKFIIQRIEPCFIVGDSISEVPRRKCDTDSTFQPQRTDDRTLSNQSFLWSKPPCWACVVGLSHYWGSIPHEELTWAPCKERERGIEK